MGAKLSSRGASCTFRTPRPSGCVQCRAKVSREEFCAPRWRPRRRIRADLPVLDFGDRESAVRIYLSAASCQSSNLQSSSWLLSCDLFIAHGRPRMSRRRRRRARDSGGRNETSRDPYLSLAAPRYYTPRT